MDAKNAMKKGKACFSWKQLPDNKWERYALFLLVAIYFFGVLGIMFPFSRNWFLTLTPLSLIYTFALLAYFQPGKNLAFFMSLLSFIGLGYGVEFLGVQTGVIFGSYEYLWVLGPKLGGVPPMIGINWAILVMATGGLLAYSHWPRWLMILLSAALMVFVDVLIEPVAIFFEFWQWEIEVPPIQNYFAWALVAILLQYIYFYGSYPKKNPLAPLVLVLQIFFFFTLCSFLYIFH